MAEGLAHIENTSGLKPALINIEDAWQIGYLLEQLENDYDFHIFDFFDPGSGRVPEAADPFVSSRINLVVQNRV